MIKNSKETISRILMSINKAQEELQKLISTNTNVDFNEFKTFNDLCEACGITEDEFKSRWLNKGFDSSTIAFEKIRILTKAYNQDWEYDLHNTNQKKWYPWFSVLPSGSGFALSDAYCYYGYTGTDVGSRLCFETKEKANHAGRNFSDIFYEFITAKN